MARYVLSSRNLIIPRCAYTVAVKSAHPTLFAHAVPAAPLKLRSKARFGDAFQDITHHCLSHIRHNMPGVLAGDPESLHQMRIGVRRLRALLDGTRDFGVLPADTARKLQWLGQELGKARNWDVFLDSTLPHLGVPHLAPEAREQIRGAARQMAVQVRQDIRNMLEGPRCRSLMEELALWDGERLWSGTGRSQPWGKDARKIAQALLRQSRKRVGKRVRQLGAARPDSLHSLRIAVKKERYLREFFDSLSPRDARQRSRVRLRVLSGAQEKLGQLNDNLIACELLRSLQAHFPAQAASLAFMEGLLTAQQAPAMKAAVRFARRKLAA